jgi:hypothetical protein
MYIRDLESREVAKTENVHTHPPVLELVDFKAVFLNCRAAAWYQALASIIPGCEVLLEFVILVF